MLFYKQALSLTIKCVSCCLLNNYLISNNEQKNYLLYCERENHIKYKLAQTPLVGKDRKTPTLRSIEQCLYLDKHSPILNQLSGNNFEIQKFSTSMD